MFVHICCLFGISLVRRRVDLANRPIFCYLEIPHDLPEKLGEELHRLEEMFTVDTALLKKITQRFGEELQAGKLLRIVQERS